MERRYFRSEAGFNFLEIMVATSILTIIALGTAQLMRSFYKFQGRTNQIISLANLSNRIRAAVLSTQGWNSTVFDALNPNLLCLQLTTGDCSAINSGIPPLDAPPYVADGTNTFQILYEPIGDGNASGGPDAGELLIDNRVVSNGFTLDGSACTTYPSDACPIRYTMDWRPLSCTGVPCSNPTIEVNFRLIPYTPTNPETFPNINVRNYSVQIVREFGNNFSAAACGLIGGTWAPGPPAVCNIDYTTACNPALGPAAYAIGLNAAGDVVCTTDQCRPGEYVSSFAPLTCTPYGIVTAGQITTCPAGQKLVALNNNGQFVCRNNVDVGATGACPVGHVVRGINADGSKICGVGYITGGTCPNGQVVRTISNTGVVTCSPAACAAGQVMQTLNTGATVCVSNTVAASCPVGQAVRVINATGTVACVAVPPVLPRTIYNCETIQQVNMPAPGQFYATCPGGKIAVGGGGYCGPFQSVQASEAWPVNSATGSNQWHVICSGFSIIGNVTAVCCSQN